jgi:thiamine-phosphate diphosphorylase
MLPRLHIITDDAVLAAPAFAADAAAMLEACGSDVAFHLRGHATSAARRHALAVQLAAAALRSGARLLINDRIDIAMAVRANGVQLGERSLEIADARLLLGAGAIIGYSAHGALECAYAAASGADFALAGTIWGSASHPERAPGGEVLLRACVAGAPLPVVAIGGVTPDRVAAVAAAGAHGVAVLGGIWHAADRRVAAAVFRDSVRAAYGEQDA